MYSFRFTIPAISIVGIFLVIAMNGAYQGHVQVYGHLSLLFVKIPEEEMPQD